MNKKIFLLLIGIALVLQISFVIAINSNDEANLQIITNKPTCITSGNNYHWEVPMTGNTYDECNWLDEWGTDQGETCCPSEHECIENQGSWICIPSNIQGCSRYQNQQDCESDPSHAAESDVARKLPTIYGRTASCGSIIKDTYYNATKGKSCTGYITGCGCEWKETAATKCQAKWTYAEQCDTIISKIGTCNYLDKGTSECTNELMKLSWDVSWTPATSMKPEWCIGGEKTIPCPPTLALKFFTLRNIISVILVVMAVYLVINFCKRKFNKDKLKTKKKK